MMINGQHSQGKAVEGKQKDRTEEAKRRGLATGERIGSRLQEGFLAVCPVLTVTTGTSPVGWVVSRYGCLGGNPVTGQARGKGTIEENRENREKKKEKSQNRNRIKSNKINQIKKGRHASEHTATLGPGTKIKVDPSMR